MRKRSLGVIVSSAAFLQLVFAAEARAQTPAPTDPPPAYPPAAPMGAPSTVGPPPAYPAPAVAPAYPGGGPPPGYATSPTAPYPAADYPPGQSQPSFATPMPGPVVMLRANNPRARLQQMQLRWNDVCMVPCGVAVDPSGMYRIGGGTIRPTTTFRMPRPSGQVFIDANVGSTVKRWVGFGLGVWGLGVTLNGLVYLAGGSTTTVNGVGQTADDAYKTMGIASLIVGGILMAVGIPMWAGSRSQVNVR